ncbi:MAG: hypothetical protein QUV06_01140 [Cyanobium sp. CZS 48M]|nr:hypothetical protein [Cyanobium sp. CZS48M]
MSWDPVLLRKYNNTGHFRLLNQLRSELKTSPLNREEPGDEDGGGRSRTGTLVRAVDVRPQLYGRARRFAGPAPAPNLPPAASTDGGSGSAGFRERLNAVEMR